MMELVGADVFDALPVYLEIIVRAVIEVVALHARLFFRLLQRHTDRLPSGLDITILNHRNVLAAGTVTTLALLPL